MRKLIAGCGLLAGAIAVWAQGPSLHASADERPTEMREAMRAGLPAQTAAKPAASTIDAAKQADIRQLMEVTGVNSLGDQLLSAGIAQFRANILESQPDNPRAKQFADAFASQFQKHFDPHSVAETVIPIYDKHLSAEDLKALLDYYKSAFGQRMLKVLPEVARDSQMAGYSLGQKAAEEAMDDLKADYPEFVPSGKQDEKHPGPGTGR
jgi:hypothetical protein